LKFKLRATLAPCGAKAPAAAALIVDLCDGVLIILKNKKSHDSISMLTWLLKYLITKILEPVWSLSFE